MMETVGSPFELLGLGPDASIEEIRQARRSLAKQLHPDLGGDAGQMQVLNAAAERALEIAGAQAETSPAPPAASSAPDHDDRGDDHSLVGDVPSFVVEALPVDTFEALLVVTSWIGEVVDDDPPYRLEVRLDDPLSCWCRLDVVPDAGSSTVSLYVLAADESSPAPDVELVRDVWIDQLNRYDWP